MFRRSVPASVSARAAAAVLVAAMLALSGCKIETSAGSPAGDPAAGDSTASGYTGSGVPSRAGSLITEPGAGFSPVYGLINGARHSIDLTMYELSDHVAEDDLAAAARRGVSVRVVLDHKEARTNSAAYQYLGSHAVRVTWSSARYQYTHQKTMVTDGSQAIIMTANLTSKYYPTSRDFLVTDASPADVSAIISVFNADFTHARVTPGDGQDLVWSPTDAQDRLLGVINGAAHSLRIYSEEMADATVEKALIKTANRGVDVQVCGENTGGQYDRAFAKLAKGGVHISYYSSPDGFYIHGKVIAADYGSAQAKVFIGSENFSSTSFNRNRELGLITANGTVMTSIARTFAADFRNGTQWR
jgi:phosphatidylserine/phosphatidylglycerophosphate/cardiolipin synthase-like enzyme